MKKFHVLVLLVLSGYCFSFWKMQGPFYQTSTFGTKYIKEKFGAPRCLNKPFLSYIGDINYFFIYNNKQKYAIGYTDLSFNDDYEKQAEYIKFLKGNKEFLLSLENSIDFIFTKEEAGLQLKVLTQKK